MCLLRTENFASVLGPGASTYSTAHSPAVRRQRKPLGCAVFCKGGTTGFPSTAIALSTTPQDLKRAINVFSVAFYQAYVINYSPVPIISQVIATLFCPANCRKGGGGEGGGWWETPISTKLHFTRHGKCLLSWK